MKRILWIGTVICLALVALPAAAGKLEPKGKNAILIIAIDPDTRSPEDVMAELRANPKIASAIGGDDARLRAVAEDELANIPHGDYDFWTGAFDPVKQQSTLGYFADFRSLLVYADKTSHRRWLVGKVAAGDVAFYGLYLQNFWGLCFDAASIYVHVEPGSYNYLGHYAIDADGRRIIAAVRQGVMPAQTQNRNTAFGYRLDSFHAADATAPTFGDDLAAATAFMKAQSGADVQMTTPKIIATPIHVSSDPIAGSCGGWYR